MKNLIFALFLSLSLLALGGCKSGGAYGDLNGDGSYAVSDETVIVGPLDGIGRPWCAYMGEVSGVHTVIRYTFLAEASPEPAYVSEQTITFTNTKTLKVYKTQGISAVWKVASPAPLIVAVKLNSYDPIDETQWNAQKVGYGVFNIPQEPLLQIIMKTSDFDLMGSGAVTVNDPQTVYAYACDEIDESLAMTKANQP